MQARRKVGVQKHKTPPFPAGLRKIDACQSMTIRLRATPPARHVTVMMMEMVMAREHRQ
jgi:hypothetical protein